MMAVLIAIALKSVIVAGAALGLLALMKRRSAAERSSVAHIGLVALVLLALAPLVLPSWNVEIPSLLAQAPEAAAPQPVQTAPAALAVEPTGSEALASTAIESVSLSPAAAAAALYALPAALLLLITFLALARLVALRARADVLVDGHWLSALARAQRRMGFKHGTALLTSDELASPVSWGLMRPVILLNSRAVEAAGEAEAIIAHELAHVARMDWIKLLLARVACALFWFSPLVWMLAREAHQLREEAADDAVLGADIPDTDYAQLLVGVARHECPGLLLGAHGVAPSKGSLARRVARVLDGGSARGPVARSFALGVFSGAVMLAAPLAALTFTPRAVSDPAAPAQARAAAVAAGQPAAPYYEADEAAEAAETPTNLPSIIAEGVSTSVATAVAAVSPVIASDGDESDVMIDVRLAAEEAREIGRRAREAAQLQREAAHRQREEARRQREAAREAREAAREAREAARAGRDHAIDRVIEMKAVGITPEYVAAMRAAAPRMGNVDSSEFVGMKAVGVTPEYAREMVAAGFRNITEDELTEARAVGLHGRYIRDMKSAGVDASLDEYIQLWAVGVRPDYVRSLHSAGHRIRNVDQLVEMQALGIKPRDLGSATTSSSTRSGELQLSVGRGVTVRSKDGRYSCSDATRCRFQLSGTVVLVATGKGGLRWSGCHRLLSASSCEMRIGRDPVVVRVA